MSGFGRKITAAAVAMSLCAVPTAAIAASPAAPVAMPATAVPASQTAAPTSPWLTLSAMTTSSSAATAAAAAEDYDDGPGWPPIAPLIVILATIAVAIYIVTKDDSGDLHFQPVSPA
jgi:hypothetical protein